MCRAFPARVVRMDGETAWIDDEGREHAVSLLGVEGVAVGDYVYHHAGLALQRLEPEEAAAVLAAYAELAALWDTAESADDREAMAE